MFEIYHQPVSAISKANGSKVKNSTTCWMRNEGEAHPEFVWYADDIEDREDIKCWFFSLVSISHYQMIFPVLFYY